MERLDDCFGRTVRLTDERLAHILEHPEMRDLAAELKLALRQPRLVRRSRSDPAARLFYDYLERTGMGGKWLCVVVKHAEDDAVVVTPYLTDRPKDGEVLWPPK